MRLRNQLVVFVTCTLLTFFLFRFTLFRTVEDQPEVVKPPEAMSIEEILTRANKMQVLAIDPRLHISSGRKADYLLEYGIIGRTSLLNPKDRRELGEALIKGEVWDPNQKRVPLGCSFQPRHGVIADYHGRHVEMLICYQCDQETVTLDAGSPEWSYRRVGTSWSAKPLLDHHLKQAGISLAP